MSDQTISSAGLALIKSFEGCRLVAYPDSGGVLTIGYGHTSGAGAPQVTSGMQITSAEAETILLNDLEKFEAIVRKHVTVVLTQNQFDALTSFVYNLGEGNFAKSTLLKDVNAGDFAAAKMQFAKWTRAGGQVLMGLVRRRAAEAALFGTPSVTVSSAQPSTLAASAAASTPASPKSSDPLSAIVDTLNAVFPQTRVITTHLPDLTPPATSAPSSAPAGDPPSTAEAPPMTTAASTNIVTGAETAAVDVFAGIKDLFGFVKTGVASGAKVANSGGAAASALGGVVSGVENMVTGDHGAFVEAIDTFIADLDAKKWGSLPHDIEACLKTGFAILTKFGVSVPIASAIIAALPDIPAIG